ncbi:cell surface complex protein, CscD family [Lacticaseibacillus paracasei]
MKMRKMIVRLGLVLLIGFFVTLVMPIQIGSAATSTAQFTVLGTLPDTDIHPPIGPLPESGGVIIHESVQNRLPATSEGVTLTAFMLGLMLTFFSIGGLYASRRISK